MKVEVAVLGSPSLIVLTVSVDVKKQWKKMSCCSELRNCVKVELDVLGSTSLIALTVSVDVKKYWKKMSCCQKLRWTSLIVLTVSVDVKHLERGRRPPGVSAVAFLVTPVK